MLSFSALCAKRTEFNITFIGRAMREALRDPLLTVEARVQFRVTLFEIRGRLNGNGAGLSPSSLCLPLLNIIPPMFHAYLLSPFEVCDSPEERAYYHILDLQVRALCLT
jgi:hypothetical protein